MIRRLSQLRRELTLNARAWFAERRLRAETVSDLVDTVTALRARVAELEVDLDEVRADSRRVAELSILVEDALADGRPRGSSEPAR